MRIEIIGGMGVGKTTLCKALEASSLHCVYESLEKNPYLDLSYKDPETFGFYSQISFILGNFYTATQTRQANNGITFFDYSTITDRAYASLFLGGKGRDIALQMIDFLEHKEGRADLYLYLTCSAETQLQRIRSRNRDHEKGVGVEFIKKLDAYVAQYVRLAELDGARVLNLNAETMDLRPSRDYITSLTMKIRHMLQTPFAWSRKGPGRFAPDAAQADDRAPAYVEMAKAV